MDCIDAQALMGAMLDGELSPEEETALHTHMETCERCRCYYALLQALQGAPEADAPDPPADLTERIMTSVRAAAPPVTPIKKKARILGFPARSLALAAAAALVILIGWSGGALFRNKGAAPDAAKPMLAAAAPAAEESVEMEESAEDPETPKNGVNADYGVSAESAAAGSVPAENDAAQNASMSLFRTDQTMEAAFDALPVPFTLWDGEEKMSEGADCGKLNALAYQSDVVFPAPEREPDYTLRDEAGEILWSLWKDGDQLLLCRDGDTAASLRAQTVWDTLGIEP